MKIKKTLLLRAATVLLSFLLLIPTFLYLFRPSPASASWWDESYAYRQKITFTHNADISTERRITFSLDTAELISAGAMQSDCDDTRFTDINGLKLRFQLTGTCDDAATTYEVVFPQIFNGTNVGYVYYGNATATSASEDVTGVTALTPSGGDPTITTRASEEKSPAPVVYYKLDEGYGAITHSSGLCATCSATLENFDSPPTATSGWTEDAKAGNALRFDGTDNRVAITDQDSLDYNNTGLTVSAWFNNTTLPTAGNQDLTLLSKSYWNSNSDNGGYDLELWYDSGNTYILFYLANSSGSEINQYSTIPFTDTNIWHHATATYDGSNVKLYLDGKLIKTDSYTGGIKNVTQDFQIGAYTDGAHFPGLIDEVKVYPYVRTADQIKTDATHLPSSHGSSVVLGDDSSFLTEGLVGYWPLDEDTGTAANDYSGNSNNGTLTNSPTWGTGKFGTGVYFDNLTSDNEYVDISNVADDIQTGDFTISTWFKLNSDFDSGESVNQTLFDLDSGSDSNNIVIFLDASDGTINLGMYNGTAYKYAWGEPTSWTAGTWYHLTATFNTTDGMKIYINGTRSGSSDNNTTRGTTPYATNTRIGLNYDNGDDFKGTIDEVRVYNRALSPTEVERLYDWAAGPIGHWTFDENQGTTTYDSSGNGNDGTFSGTSTVWAPGKFGSALKFVDKDDFDPVTVPDNSLLDFGVDRDFTLSAWINTTQQPASSQWPSVFEKFDYFGGSTGYGIVVYLQTNRYWYGQIWEDDTNYGAGWEEHIQNPFLGDGQWHHLVFMRKGDILYSYTDGAPSDWNDSYSAGNLDLSNTGDLYFGNEFEGRLDDLRIYNYALSPKQITSVMNADHPSVGSPVGSPVVHYKLDEGYGTVTASSGSCSTCSATLNNFDSPATYGSGWTDNGKFAKALNFDGNDDYIGMSDDYDALDYNGTGITVSAWFNASSITQTSDTQNVIAQKMYWNSATDNGGWQLKIYNYGGAGQTQLEFICFNSSGTSNIDGNDIPFTETNVWHHVIGTYDGQTIKMYLDGKLVDSNLYADGCKNITEPLWISDDYPNGSFDGTLDDIKVYDYVLTSSQVKAEFNQSKAIVLGSLSTQSDQKTASNSASAAYCPPGNTDTCNPPIAHWTLDENTGTTAHDISGNDFNGTLTNGPLWDKGKIGQALKFDGDDDYVSVSHDSTLNLNGDFTIEFWARLNGSTETSSWPSIIGKGDSSTANGWLIYETASTNIVYFKRDGWDSPMTTSELSSTDLKHFTLTYDKSDQALLGYVNGILEVEDSGVSFSTNNGTDDLAMADTDNAGNIVLDDIRIYDDVRTPAQVAWDYNRGGPVAWYRFDECQGSVAHDASGNNSHGTITSGGAYGNTSVGSCNSGDSTEMWDDGTNGKFNSALGLDGDDDYASSSSQLFYNEQPQFSFFAWIKRSAINNWDRVGGAYEWNSGNYGSWYLNTGQNNGAPACGALIDGSWEATTTDNNSLGQTGRWYHVGCVYDGSNLISYLDGVPQDSVSASGNLASTAYPFLIGTTNGISGTQNNFQGLIDDARIYNYGLTPAQVRTLYNGGSAIRFAPLTGSP